MLDTNQRWPGGEVEGLLQQDSNKKVKRQARKGGNGEWLHRMSSGENI